MGKKAVHFGAGNIGRGFIGPLLMQAGYHVIFADIDRGLIDKINDNDEYSIYFLEPKKKRPMTVDDFSGVVSTSESLIKDIASPDVKLITTSVGIAVLPKIATSIAKGISQRRKAERGTMNVIACENGVGATDQLREAVFEHLSKEDRQYAEKNVGFANCTVDRIVPPFEHDSPLDVGVESFYEWIVCRSSLKGLDRSGTLGIKGMGLTDDLLGYVERKLFTLNCGHAITAYLGYLKGHSTIFDSIKDQEILSIVEGSMNESGAALLKKHSEFKQEGHQDYIQKTLERFRNPNVEDDVKRVGRQPLRKLSKNDRLLGPMYIAREYDLSVDNLAHGVAAAMLYKNEEDEQAVELNKKVADLGIEKAVAEVTGFEEGSKEFGKIMKAYQELKKWKTAL